MTATGESRYSEPEAIFKELEKKRRWPNDLSSKVNIESCDKTSTNKKIQRKIVAEEVSEECEFTPREYKKETSQRTPFESRYNSEPEAFESTSTEFIETEVEPIDCGECLGEGETQCTECNGDGVNHCPNCNSSGEVRCDCETGSISCPVCHGQTYIDCKKCEPNGRINCKNCEGGTVDCECTNSGEAGKRTKKITETRTTRRNYNGDRDETIPNEHKERIRREETTICDTCDGAGERDCEKCGGIGSKPCQNCDSGSYLCDNCKGGEVTCAECDGDPISRCRDCSGEGMIPCEPCNGQGTHPCEVCDQTGDLFYAKVGEVRYRSKTREKATNKDKIQQQIGKEALETIRAAEGYQESVRVETPHGSPTPEREVVLREETEIRTVPVQKVKYSYEDSEYTLYEIDGNFHCKSTNQPFSEIAKAEQKVLGVMFVLGVLFLIGLLIYLFLFAPQ